MVSGNEARARAPVPTLVRVMVVVVITAMTAAMVGGTVAGPEAAAAPAAAAKVLLVGYGWYTGIPPGQTNIAELVACDLHGKEVEGATIHSLVVPVTWAGAFPPVAEAIERLKPMMVIGMGCSPGAPGLRIERYGANLMYGGDSTVPEPVSRGMKDAKGTITYEHIRPGGPPYLETTTPNEAMVEACLKAGIPAYLGDKYQKAEYPGLWFSTTGTYLCNFMTYMLPTFTKEKGLNIPVGFIHIPTLPQYVAMDTLERSRKEIAPSMSREVIRDGVREAIRAALQAGSDRPAASQPGGSQLGASRPGAILPAAHARLSCTIMGATGSRTASGKPLIASTSDDPWNTRTRVVVHTPRDGYKYIGTQIITPPDEPRVPWSDMMTRGLNERGFAYTWSYVHPKTEPAYDRAEGLTFREAGEMLLSRASRVDEAIELMKKHPRAYHGNFLLADSGGKLALVEVSTKSINVETLTTDGAVGRSNHWTSSRMEPVGEKAQAHSSTAIRLERITHLLAEHQRALDVESISKIYRDHWGRDTWGYSICQHGEAPGKNESTSGTVSAEIMDPARLLFWYNYGWPCGQVPKYPEQQKYQERSWGAYLPFFLPLLSDGEYVTTDGRLTPLAVRYLADRITAITVPLK